MNEVLSLSGTEQARRIRGGSVSSRALVEAHLQRIAGANPGINAVVEVLRESALTDARAADERRSRGESLGPLDGVPFSVKDSIAVAGAVCSAGTIGLRHAPPC